MLRNPQSLASAKTRCKATSKRCRKSIPAADSQKSKAGFLFIRAVFSHRASPTFSAGFRQCRALFSFLKITHQLLPGPPKTESNAFQWAFDYEVQEQIPLDTTEALHHGRDDTASSGLADYGCFQPA